METNELTVRPAEPDDINVIARLYLEVAPEVVAREPKFRQIPDAGDIERRYRSRIPETDRTVFVAVNGDAVVGFVDSLLRHHGDTGTYNRPGTHVYVEELIVTAAERRRGVATALMRAVEAWGRASHARMVWLETHLTNQAALQLYRANGYREAGVVLLKDL